MYLKISSLWFTAVCFVSPTLALGTDVTYFECDDGCQIQTRYFDDGNCDCAQCEDEPNWSCDTCACANTCGAHGVCGSNFTAVCTHSTDAEDSYYTLAIASFNVTNFAGNFKTPFVYANIANSTLGDLSIYVQHANTHKQVFGGGKCAEDEENLRAFFSDYGSENACESNHSYDRIYDAVSYQSLATFNRNPTNGLWNVIVVDGADESEGMLLEACIGWVNDEPTPTSTNAPNTAILSTTMPTANTMFVAEMCADLNYVIEDFSTVFVPFKISNIPDDANGLYVYVDAIHYRLSDLRIFLKHGGFRKHVFYNQCEGSDLRSYFSDDGSEDVCSGNHSYERVYDSVSYQSLAAFNSLSRNGLWTVGFSDDVGGFEGVLKRVCFGWNVARNVHATASTLTPTITTLPPKTTMARITTTTSMPDTSAIQCKNFAEYLSVGVSVTASFDLSHVAANATDLFVFVDVTHSALDNLRIFVEHSGVRRFVFYEQCADLDDLRAIFHDKGSEDVCYDSNNHSYDQVYDALPFHSLGLYNTLPKNGSYEISVSDVDCCGTGYVHQLCIGWRVPERIDTTTAVPSTTTAPDNDGNSQSLLGYAIAAIVCCVIVILFVVGCCIRFLIAANSPASAAPVGAGHIVTVQLSSVGISSELTAPMPSDFASDQREGFVPMRCALPTTNSLQMYALDNNRVVERMENTAQASSIGEVGVGIEETDCVMVGRRALASHRLLCGETPDREPSNDYF